MEMRKLKKAGILAAAALFRFFFAPMSGRVFGIRP